MNRSILVLNGPGLADLGEDSGQWFGTLMLDDIRAACQATCDDLGYSLDFRQTDEPDKMCHWIARDSESFDAIIVNPAGRSKAMMETSELYRSAIRTLAALRKPVVEVHISNIFRPVEEVSQWHHEPEGDMGFVCGLGKHGYTLAIRAVNNKLTGHG